MQQIPGPILATPVAGLNLPAATLGDCLDAPATLLIFLRHLHCMFCRETVADVRRLTDAGRLPPAVLVAQGPVEAASDYFARHWPAARVVADATLGLFDAFDVGRARFGGLMGPAVWSCAMRAKAKGHRQHPVHALFPPHGDPWRLSATFVVAPGGRVEWFHRAKYAGDRPDYAAIPWAGGAVPDGVVVG